PGLGAQLAEGMGRLSPFRRLGTLERSDPRIQRLTVIKRLIVTPSRRVDTDENEDHTGEQALAHGRTPLEDRIGRTRTSLIAGWASVKNYCATIGNACSNHSRRCRPERWWS